jgi:phosphate-selective porin OprO/OprP
MKNLLKLLLIAVLILPLSGITAKAQSTKAEIEQLKQQIKAIQEQNQRQIQQLQQQIQQLENSRAQTDQNLAQINQKQQEAEGAWYNKFMSNYDHGFVFESKDKEGFPFKLKFGILSQVQAFVNDQSPGDVQTNFRLRRLEISFAGYAFAPWFYYHFMIDPASKTNGKIVQDMYFTAAYRKEIGPRIGQWKVPFEKEELQSSSALQLVERSIVNQQFTLERDIGLALQGVFGPHNNFSYAGGVFNGDGNNGTSTNSSMLYAGRIQLGLGGDGDDKYDADGTYASAKEYGLTPNFAKEPTLVIGAAASYMPGLDCSIKTPNGQVCNRISELQFGNQVNFTQIEGDAMFKMKYFNVEGEYDGRWLNPQLGTNPNLGTAYDQGFRAQAGVFLVPKTLELAGRYALVDFDTSSNVVPPGTSVQSKTWEITPGLNYYMSHDHRWKIQLSYTYERQEFTQGAPDIKSNIVRAQVQANF